MTFLETPEEATDLYDADRASQGYVANYTKVFAHRPAVYKAWQQLNASVKEGMDLRRYELATLAAARQLRSSYCALAHGKVLRDNFFDAGTLRDIATDHENAGLDATDIAVMNLAEKVARDATAVTAADLQVLRDCGLSEADILQVVLAAAARCFFSKVLDGVGAQPDAQYRASIEPDLQAALTFGRPIAAD